MAEEFENLKKRQLTFSLDFAEFIRHWLELELLILRNPEAKDYALQLERILGQFSRQRRPLSRAAARRKGETLKPYTERNLSPFIRDQIDEALRHPWLTGMSRTTFVRLCVRRGLDVLSREPVARAGR